MLNFMSMIYKVKKCEITYILITLAKTDPRINSCLFSSPFIGLAIISRRILHCVLS